MDSKEIRMVLPIQLECVCFYREIRVKLRNSIRLKVTLCEMVQHSVIEEPNVVKKKNINQNLLKSNGLKGD